MRLRRIVGVVMFVGGIGWPAIALLNRALDPIAGRSGLSLSTVGRVLSSARTWRLVGETAAQATMSAVIATVLGAAIAWLVVRNGVAAPRLLMSVLFTGFVVPSLAMGAAVRQVADWVPALAPYPRAQIVLAHVLFNVGFVARAVAPALDAVSTRHDGAARLLGRTPAGAAMLVLRMSAPALAGAASVVFVLSATSFGTVLALGGGSTTTLEVEIWYQATRLVDLPVAAVLSLVQLVLVVGVVSLATRWGRRTTPSPARPSPRQRARVLPSMLAWSLTAAIVALPVGALAISALRSRDGWTLDHVRALVDPPAFVTDAPLSALTRSLMLAVVAGVVAAALAMAVAAERSARWVRQVTLGPLGASAATVGLAWLVAYSRAIDLRGTVLLVAAVQTVVIVPLAVYVLAPAMDRTVASLNDACRVLAVARHRFWIEVQGPMLGPSIAMAVALGGAAALGEIGATSIVATDRHLTASVLMQQLLSRPGNVSSGLAAVIGLVLVLFAGLAVGLAGRGVARRGTG